MRLIRIVFLAAPWIVPALLVAEQGRFEKTIPFPRSGEARLGWSHEKCTIRGVQVRNYPNREDIEKARRRK